MKRTEIHHPASNFRWIDITDPNPAELNDLAREFNLHETSVKDCLEPYHLPKFEALDEHLFVMLRVVDENAPKDASTVLELTRKIAIFICTDIILTIHRTENPTLTSVFKKWESRLKTYPSHPRSHLAFDLISEGLTTFDHELDKLEDFSDEMELAVFDIHTKPYNLRSMFLAKRRIAVCRRLLRLTNEVIAKIAADAPEELQIYVRDLKEDGEHTFFYAEELLESMNQLVATHHSVESQKANEVMKVLAIFSAFFLPLTLIAGIYGMNFKLMPELEYHFGYPICLLFMAATAFVIWMWFRKKKWL